MAHPPPVLVNLESSLACNLRCPMCAPYRTGGTKRPDRMDPALLERLAAEVLPHAELVELTVAGEPLLHPDLEPFVELSERLGFRFRIQSNGTVLPPEPLLTRLLARTEVLSFSVDACSPALYARLRGRDWLPRVLDNIREVSFIARTMAPAERPRLGLAVVLMRSNLHELGPLVELADELGLDEVAVSHLTAFDAELDAESLRHEPERADRMIVFARQRARVLGLGFSAPPRMDGTVPTPPSMTERVRHLQRAAARDPVRRLRRWWRLRRRRRGLPVDCAYLQHRIYIGVDGRVRPCCMPERPLAGDLREQSFAEIWEGEVLTGMREAFAAGRPWECCTRCSANRLGDYVPGDPETVRPPSVQLD